jgi:hypothetical protein
VVALSIPPSHVERVSSWIRTRGGVAVWPNLEIGGGGGDGLTPALDEDGKPTACPGWRYAKAPSQIVTDPAEVLVTPSRDVCSFRVGVRRGDGLSFVLTDGAQRNVNKALAKYSTPEAPAQYYFDYERQHAVITVPLPPVSLTDYLATETR